MLIDHLGNPFRFIAGFAVGVMQPADRRNTERLARWTNAIYRRFPDIIARLRRPSQWSGTDEGRFASR